jgi:hypothetical protein
MGWVLSFEDLESGRRRRHHSGRQYGQQRYSRAAGRLWVVADPTHVWKLHAREPGDLESA